MKKLSILTVVVILLFSPLLAVAQGGAGGNTGGAGGNTGGSGGLTGGAGGYTGGAGGNCPPGKMCLTNPAKAESVAAFFEAVFNAIFILILPIAVLAMAGVGLMFVAARGNPEKLTRAKNAFLYTVLGTALIFGILVLLKMLTSLAEALGGPV